MKTPPTAQRRIPRPVRKRRAVPLCVVALALYSLSAAAAPPSPPAAVAATVPVPVADSYRLPENPRELLRLDDEMRAYFAACVRSDSSSEDQIEAILAAIIGEKGLRFRYEEFGLYDVREAYRRRQGNCLTLSALIVAVAREFRMQARFNDVPTRPNWSRAGRIVLEENHINVRLETVEAVYEIDFDARASRQASRDRGHPIADQRALASLYSNAGVYRLIDDDSAGALRFLRLATQIDPDYPAGWTNLAGAYLLARDPTSARHCYERALAAAPAHLAALDGLARISREEGDLARAEKLERKVSHYRERNPYYLLHVARAKLADGDIQGAHQNLSRAVRIKDNDPEILEALVETSHRLGRQRESSR